MTLTPEFSEAGSSGMTFYTNPTTLEIAQLLKRSKRIAVVGLSSNPERPSNAVAQYLIGKGYEVIPVNPAEQRILGQKSYTSLRDIDDGIDIVDVFRRSEQTDAIIDEAIALKAGAIWLQEQVINHTGALRAVAAGLVVVQDLCIKKELMRL